MNNNLAKKALEQNVMDLLLENSLDLSWGERADVVMNILQRTRDHARACDPLFEHALTRDEYFPSVVHIITMQGENHYTRALMQEWAQKYSLDEEKVRMLTFRAVEELRLRNGITRLR